MGRTRKYNTALALRRALEDYFSSISRIRQVTEERSTGERDKYGHAVMELVPVQNSKGEIMTEREYLIPPTVGGLCQHLGISRVTWAQYCSGERNPQFAETTTWAREQLLAWRERELMIRPGRDLPGVMFDLQMNYGMSDKGGPASIAQDDDPITKSLKETRRDGLI